MNARRPDPSIFAKPVDLSDGGLAYRIEFEKARRMAEVFASEPDLTTPRLVDADEERGLLIFERVAPLRPLSIGVERTWFERAGRALALIHSRLELPEELCEVRAADVGRKGLVFVHGDFNPNNLGIAGDCLVVFDWGLRPWTLECYTRATPSVDLAAFLGPWLLPLWWEPRLPIVKLLAMIDTYLREIGSELSAAELARSTLLEALAENYGHRLSEIRRRSALRRLPSRLKFEINRSRLERALARHLPL